MKFKAKNKIAMLAAIVSAVLFPLSAAASLETEEKTANHDFTFGLSDKFSAVKAYSEDEDGRSTWDRFVQVRSELPDEVPVFEPYDIEGKYEIFVSPNGSDINPGTKERPLKTLEAAVHTAGKIKGRDGSIVIYLREGIYNVENTMTIPGGISGTDEHPTFISAYKDENVTFTGGVTVDGKNFKIADDELALRKLPKKAQGKVYSVDLKKLGIEKYPKITKGGGIPTLDVDGIQYDLARWPNTGVIHHKKYEGEDGKKGVIDIGPVTSSLTGNTITGDTGEGFEFLELVTQPFTWENTEKIWLRGSFDAEYLQANYRVRRFNKERNSVRTFDCTQYGAEWNASLTHYYMNVMEELDIPGEWFLDDDTGMLYIYPISDLTDAQISIPIGDKELIAFEEGVHNVVVSNITFKGTTVSPAQVSGYRNLFQRCIVEGGFVINRGKNCGLINSKIMGGVGVNYGLNEGMESMDAQNLRPTRNFVQNNIIIGGNLGLRTGVQTILSHNTIMNSQTMCIYIAEAQESIIEYNEVVGGPAKTIDAGMIYVEGHMLNLYNHVRYNYFHHDRVEMRSMPMGVYFDDRSCNNFAYGNICQHVCMHMNGGSNNVFYNNVVLDETANYNAMSNNGGYVTGGYASIEKAIIEGTAYSYYFNKNGYMKTAQVTWKNRYPSHYITMNKWLPMVQLEGRAPDYRRGDTMIDWIRPRNNVYKNNIIAYCKSLGEYEKIEPQRGEIGSWFDTNYIMPDDKVLFEDYANRNYNIENLGLVYENIPEFEPLPRQEHRGTIADEMKLVQSEPHSIMPLNDGESKANPTKTVFKWTNNKIATCYKFELADDSEFKNIIETVTIKEAEYTLPFELETDKRYWWRVTACAYAQNVENTFAEMPAATFETYTYQELLTITTLEKDNFNEKCNEALEMAETINEDTGTDIGVGVYNQGTKELIREAVAASKERVSSFALQKEVDAELEALDKTYKKLLHDNAIPYTRTYKTASADDWTWHDDRSTFNISGDEIVFEAKDKLNVTNNVDLARDVRMLSPKETVKMEVNFGDMTAWSGFAVKQIKKDAYSIYPTKGYWIVAQEGTIELQRYPVTTTAAIKVSIPNNFEIIKPNTWHLTETTFEQLDENTARIIFKVDGKVIIDYTDDDAPLFDLGYFSMMRNALAGGVMKIRPPRE